MTLAIDGLQRVKPENPYNYSEEQLAQKELHMKQLRQLYPNVCTYWAEQAYDFCMNNSEEKIKEVMYKIDNEPTKHKIPEILISNKMEILDPEDISGN